MSNFVQIWFRIDTKIMRNFVQKKSFRAKTRNCWASESTVSWKPYAPDEILETTLRFYYKIVHSNNFSLN